MTVVRTPTPDSVQALVRRHQAEVWRYLRYLGASAELADDLTQDTFVQLLQAPFAERSREATTAWLRTVARNFYVKSFRRPPFAEADLDALEAGWSEYAADDGGERTLQQLRRCLEELGGRARDAVRLHYEERRSRAVIAEHLGVGLDGVKSLLRRARAALRQCVERSREENA
ncbi:MAG: RNA polymerase sigma factor [Planctomycetota bacterium]